MSDIEEDKDLELAIALSMQQSPAAQSAGAQEIVDLTSDPEDEDADLKQAIALSLRDADLMETSGQAERNHTELQPTTAADVQDAMPTQMNTTSGVLGLDRKVMEQERLARLGKRKRDLPPVRSHKHTSKMPKITTEQELKYSSRSVDAEKLQYPRGAIKRTYATKYPRTDDITIDEVLQADTINIAVISSFMWDSEWLNEKLDPSRVKQIWIMNAKGDDVQRRWRQEMEECGIPNLKLHFPPMHGMIHNMHSKFMLLFGKDKLRIVIPTANMTPIDWGEVKNNWQPGVMENSVFLVDLPRRKDGAIGDKTDLATFGKELVYFLEKQEIDSKVVEGILKFDFTQTDQLAFVHSIGGVHKAGLEHPTGLPGLAQAIKTLKLDIAKYVELDYAASSLGAIDDILLQRLHLAARGLPFSKNAVAQKTRDHIRIYFPSEDYVKKSIGGTDCGGIITLAARHYDAKTFPRECLRTYDSTRRAMLSHNKLLFARGRQNNGKASAWVYIGSANLSESAWGAQKVLKNGQMGSLNIRNWECGVVMSVPEEKLPGLELADDEPPPMSVFQGIIEIPFVYPGEDFGRQKPWIQK